MTSATDWLLEFVADEQAPDRVDAWVARTFAAISDEVTEVVTDSELTALVETTIREHWIAFLYSLNSSEPFHLVPSAASLALALARRHLGVAVLTKLYRVAQGASWEYATTVAREAPEDLDRADLLINIWSAASSWIDAAIDESIAIHQAEARKIERRGDARRYDAVLRILRGDITNAGELSSELDGYPLDGTHRALLLTAGDSDTLARVERFARGGKATLVVRAAGHEAWVWLSDPADTPIPPEIEHEAEQGHLRVSASSPHRGLEGFTDAHSEARLLHVVAKAPGRRTATFDDAALALMASNVSTATRFVSTTLGGLADPEAAQLRATVKEVLRSPHGVDGAAKQLHVHRNTVRYRIGRAEELLGHPVRQRLGELALALEFYDAFL